MALEKRASTRQRVRHLSWAAMASALFATATCGWGMEPPAATPNSLAPAKQAPATLPTAPLTLRPARVGAVGLGPIGDGAGAAANRGAARAAKPAEAPVKIDIRPVDVPTSSRRTAQKLGDATGLRKASVVPLADPLESPVTSRRTPRDAGTLGDQYRHATRNAMAAAEPQEAAEGSDESEPTVVAESPDISLPAEGTEPADEAAPDEATEAGQEPAAPQPAALTPVPAPESAPDGGPAARTRGFAPSALNPQNLTKAFSALPKFGRTKKVTSSVEPARLAADPAAPPIARARRMAVEPAVAEPAFAEPQTAAPASSASAPTAVVEPAAQAEEHLAPIISAANLPRPAGLGVRRSAAPAADSPSDLSLPPMGPAAPATPSKRATSQLLEPGVPAPHSIPEAVAASSTTTTAMSPALLARRRFRGVPQRTTEDSRSESTDSHSTVAAQGDRKRDNATTNLVVRPRFATSDGSTAESTVRSVSLARLAPPRINDDALQLHPVEPLTEDAVDDKKLTRSAPAASHTEARVPAAGTAPSGRIIFLPPEPTPPQSTGSTKLAGARASSSDHSQSVAVPGAAKQLGAGGLAGGAKRNRLSLPVPEARLARGTQGSLLPAATASSPTEQPATLLRKATLEVGSPAGKVR